MQLGETSKKETGAMSSTVVPKSWILTMRGSLDLSSSGLHYHSENEKDV
jgi:hypothetical protein